MDPTDTPCDITEEEMAFCIKGTIGFSEVPLLVIGEKKTDEVLVHFEFTAMVSRTQADQVQRNLDEGKTFNVTLKGKSTATENAEATEKIVNSQ